MVRWAAAAIAGLILAPGEPPTDRIEIHYEAPPSCPTRDEIRAAIDAYLGLDEFDPELDEVVVTATIVADRSEWRLSVAVAGSRIDARRDVSAASCGELADAAGLIIAVALDPLRVDAHGPELEPVHAPVAPDPPPTVPPPTVPDAEPPPRRLFAELRLGAGLGLALVFGPTAVASLELAIAAEMWRIGVRGVYVGPRVARPFGDAPETGARLQGGTVGVRACSRPSLGPIMLPTCAGVGAGVLRARGVGLSEPQTAHRPWVVASIGQELAWLSRIGVGVWLGADLQVSITRPRFVAPERGEVFTSPTVGGVFAAGLAARF